MPVKARNPHRVTGLFCVYPEASLAGWGGNGLIDLETAAHVTQRSRKSLQRLYERGLLKAAETTDERGRRLFLFTQFEPLKQPGKPSELLAA